jgi:hypothetical protein
VCPIRVKLLADVCGYTEFFGDKLPAELRAIRFWAEVSKLKVTHTFFVGNLKNVSEEERRAGVMTRVASFY